MPVIIPSDDRKADFKFIHRHLLDFKTNENQESLAKAVNRMAQVPEFVKSALPLLKKGVKSPSDAMKIAWAFFYFYLNASDYVAASMILWGPKTFTAEPHAAQLMWNALFSKNLINVMGAASCGKTFAPSAWCLLDWVRDPEWTRVTVISNSEDHVKKNLYGDMVRLHQEASIELPGRLDSDSISLDKKRAMGIFVLTVPGGPNARGKLKGQKIKARPPHPEFGENSRFRVILDEAQECPANIWDEIPNLMASVDNSTEHIKILAAANPKDEFSRYGQNCRPACGWDNLPEDAEEWESETGWHVISINAMKTENVMQRKTIFPRMITYEGVQKIIRSQGQGNDQHPICFTFIYGRFPKQGLMGSIVKIEHIRRSEGEWVFSTSTQACLGHDPAFTGDLPTVATARVGRAIAWVDYAGNRHELAEPKMAIQVDAVGVLDRGDTQDLSDQIMDRCKAMGVKSGRCGIDRTGVGQGVYDITKRQWEQKVGTTDGGANEQGHVLGINYAQSPTESKICDEDSDTPKEMYDRMATELYYATAKLVECDCVRFGRGVDRKALEELASRRGGMQAGLGRKLTIESKGDYKSRTGSSSPDRADSVTIVIQVARLTTPGLVPKAKDTSIPPPPRNGQWSGFTQEFGTAQMAGLAGAGEIPDMLKD